jgi:hypothetical protein
LRWVVPGASRETSTPQCSQLNERANAKPKNLSEQSCRTGQTSAFLLPVRAGSSGTPPNSRSAHVRQCQSINASSCTEDHGSRWRSDAQEELVTHQPRSVSVRDDGAMMSESLRARLDEVEKISIPARRGRELEGLVAATETLRRHGW